MPHGAVDMDESSPVQSSSLQEAVTRTLRDGTPTDDELEELGNEIVHWEKLGRRLNVSEPKLAEISQARDQLSEKAYYMLKHWKQENGSSATYETLCNALKHRLVQRQDLAERFCCINVSGAAGSTHDSVDSTGARRALKRKRADSDPDRENLKGTLEQMGHQVKNVIEKIDSLRESTQDVDKLQQTKSEMVNISDKLDTLIAQRKTDDEDKTRDDLKEMKREMRTISEKLKSQTTSGEESSRDNLEQKRREIVGIKEKLDTLINRLPLEKKELRMEDDFDPAEIIDKIRELYKVREGWLAPFPWCEEFHFHLDSIFTRLKVVSRKKTRGTATDNIVNMSGIFNPHEECPQPRTVLIEGKPGMGKTTYCQKMVYDWATGKLKAEDRFPRFETVLLLKCRDIKSNLWEAIDDQLLLRDVEEDARKRFFSCICQNQSSVLLVLDGLDEVPPSKLPVFTEIIQGRRELPKCHVVATSRHEAGMKVRKHCDTLLQIEGFTDEDAEEFIFKYFKDMKNVAEELLSKLRSDKNLKDMAANPLNTALLCLICEELGGIFPNPTTQLYVAIIQCMLRRYRKKRGLPETHEDLFEVYDAQLKHLGKIALNGLLKHNFAFEESELKRHADELPGFGFLSAETSSSKLRPSL